jgi:hypothetical protein
MASSALASARRRRGGDPLAVPPLTPRTNKPESTDTPVQTQPITPLVVLQQHEAKIRQLEALITKEEDYEELFQQIDEKIDKLFSVNFEVYNNELNAIKSIIGEQSIPKSTINMQDNALINTTMQLQIDAQTSKIEDFRVMQTQQMNHYKEDLKHLMALLNDNNESKMALMTSSNKLLETKMNELSTSYENQKSNTHEVTKIENEVNTLKMTVINNQTIIMEMSHTMIGLKDTISAQKEIIANLTTKIDNLSSINEERNSTQALFGSIMAKNIFGNMNMRCANPNSMYCCEAGECEEPLNFETSTPDDLDVFVNNDELIIDEDQIAELLEVQNFDTINIENCAVVETTPNSDNAENFIDYIVETLVSSACETALTTSACETVHELTSESHSPSDI